MNVFISGFFYSTPSSPERCQTKRRSRTSRCPFCMRRAAQALDECPLTEKHKRNKNETNKAPLVGMWAGIMLSTLKHIQVRNWALQYSHWVMFKNVVKTATEGLNPRSGFNRRNSAVSHLSCQSGRSNNAVLLNSSTLNRKMVSLL